MKVKREKGSALIFALLITVILFILGTSFIGFLSNDYSFTEKLNPQFILEDI